MSDSTKAICFTSLAVLRLVFLWNANVTCTLLAAFHYLNSITLSPSVSWRSTFIPSPSFHLSSTCIPFKAFRFCAFHHQLLYGFLLLTLLQCSVFSFLHLHHVRLSRKIFEQIQWKGWRRKMKNKFLSQYFNNR